MLVLCLLVYGCVEPFEATTQLFEKIMVIDATITDEVKNQEIHLSSTFQFEEFVRAPEEGAAIKVVDGSMVEYPFQEVLPGKYVSTFAFGAQPGVSYQLLITTTDGRNYTSDPTMAPPSDPFFDLKATKTFNDVGEEGMSINVVYPPNNETKYYRYEYEEMYKIIAPKWTDVTLQWINEFETIQVPKDPPGGRVCYKSDESNTIIFNSTKSSDLEESLEYPIRFINNNDYFTLLHRYGIWVKQFAITRATHTYLETLKDFSGQDNILSQTQPGFFSGNVYSEDYPDEKVLGYFDVTSVTTKSLFFNYRDFYPNEPLPRFIDACAETSPDPALLRKLLDDGTVMFYLTDGFQNHFVVNRVCGDCTVLGQSEVPEFWID
ncbi:hypothetical protein FB2170_12436 [Maribacter sp. HTCC2170]|nr:hypothetical protein FB2170_12436 [Maribacter sp. HTCC2170]